MINFRLSYAKNFLRYRDYPCIYVGDNLSSKIEADEEIQNLNMPEDMIIIRIATTQKPSWDSDNLKPLVFKGRLTQNNKAIYLDPDPFFVYDVNLNFVWDKIHQLIDSPSDENISELNGLLKDIRSIYSILYEFGVQTNSYLKYVL